MVAGNGNERTRMIRALGFAGSLLIAVALPAAGQPSVTEIEVAGASFPMAVERHNGYEAVAWSRVPEAVVSRSFQRGGVATGQVSGAALELRAGSPFGRHGDRVFQLANVPYRWQGELWVPVELFSAADVPSLVFGSGFAAYDVMPNTGLLDEPARPTV